MLRSYLPNPMNVIFGNSFCKCNQVKMRSYSIRVHNSKWIIFLDEGTKTGTAHEGRTTLDEGGRGCSVRIASQVMPRIPCIPVPFKGIPMSFILLENRKKQERILLKISEEAWPCWCLDFLDFRTVRLHFCYLSSSNFYRFYSSFSNKYPGFN